MSIPQPATHLPELTQFVEQLSNQVQQGKITGWREFIPEIRSFYTPAMMVKIDQIVPGWIPMASYKDQQTLIHVTAVLVALVQLPEYQQSDPDQQALAWWTALFHDVTKQIPADKHDYIHGFRSAAVAGKALKAIGFPITEAYSASIEDWFALTYEATRYDEAHQEMIQDNAKLPAILAGLDNLFGANAPAIQIIKAVMFHISLPVDPDYPILAPLTDAEIPLYLDAPAMQMLEIMILVDNDSWNLFDTPIRQQKRQQTLDYFEQFQA